MKNLPHEFDSRTLSLIQAQKIFEENSQIIGDKIFLCLFDKSRDHKKKAEDIKVINSLIAKYGFDDDLQGRLLENVSSKLHLDFKKISLQEIFNEDIDESKKLLSQSEYDSFFTKIKFGEEIKSFIKNLYNLDIAKESKSPNKIGQAIISLFKLNSAVKNLSKDLGKIKIINDGPKSLDQQPILTKVIIEENQELFSKLRNFYTKTEKEIVPSYHVVNESASWDFSLTFSNLTVENKVLSSLNFGQYKDEIDKLLSAVNRQRTKLIGYYDNKEWAYEPFKLFSSPSGSEHTGVRVKEQSNLESTFSHQSNLSFSNPNSPELKINERVARHLKLGIENLAELKKNLTDIESAITEDSNNIITSSEDLSSPPSPQSPPSPETPPSPQSPPSSETPPSPQSPPSSQTSRTPSGSPLNTSKQPGLGGFGMGVTRLDFSKIRSP